MTKRAAIYLRVSTQEQTTENQRLELEKVLETRGWTLAAIYEDAGISGAKGRDQRPEYDRMLKGATRGEYDVLMAWSVDRLGRSLQDLLGGLGELKGANVDLYLHQQAIDTSTPAGKAMYQMLGVFAEFEREMISQRVTAGLARARSQGKTLGRPKVKCDAKAVLADLRTGLSIRKTAEKHGISAPKVQRIAKEAA